MLVIRDVPYLIPDPSLYFRDKDAPLPFATELKDDGLIPPGLVKAS